MGCEKRPAQSYTWAATRKEVPALDILWMQLLQKLLSVTLVAHYSASLEEEKITPTLIDSPVAG